jgi:hypothetical protein
MTVKTGQAWAGTFVTLDATGALATPGAGPAGVLYVDGVANVAAVTITGTNPYKWAVTLPALTAGQRVEMYISATIATIATAAVVAGDQADTSLNSDVDADVWAYSSRTLTQAAASVAAAVAGSTITCQRGDTLVAALTGLGDLSDRVKLWGTVKSDPSLADTAATLMTEETAGLTRLNGAAYTTITDGDITVTDEVTGALTWTIKPAVTKDLAPGQYTYDLQKLSAAGVVTTVTYAQFIVTGTGDITRAVA